MGLYRMLNGYQKESDTISSGQLAEYLNMARQHAGSTLKELEEQGYIERKDVGRRALEVSINWRNVVTNSVTPTVTDPVTPAVTNLVTTESSRVTNLVTNCHQISDASVTNLVHTKEKRNIPKKDKRSDLLGSDPRFEGRENFLDDLIELYGLQTVEAAWQRVPEHAKSPLPYLRTILQRNAQESPQNGHTNRPPESRLARIKRRADEQIATLAHEALGTDGR